MKKVSVVVPVYNVENYLPKCIESIINQTYKNIEIILVDDGSTDHSGVICDNFAIKYENIKAYHKQNGGLSDARNYGIGKSNGDFITFIDSDDWIESNTIEKCVKTLNKDKSDMIVYGICVDFENGNKKIRKPKKNEIIGRDESLIYLCSYRGIDVSACNKMFKRELFDNVVFPVGKISEDYYTMYKILFKINKMSIISDSFYHYFQRNNSITKNSKLNMDFLYASKEQMDFIKEKLPNINFAGETAYAFALLTMYMEKKRRKIKIDKEKDVKSARKYCKSVLKNNYLSFVRKIQYILFAYFTLLYDLIIKIKG